MKGRITCAAVARSALLFHTVMYAHDVPLLLRSISTRFACLHTWSAQQESNVHHAETVALEGAAARPAGRRGLYGAHHEVVAVAVMVRDPFTAFGACATNHGMVWSAERSQRSICWAWEIAAPCRSSGRGRHAVRLIRRTSPSPILASRTSFLRTCHTRGMLICRPTAAAQGQGRAGGTSERAARTRACPR